MVQMIGLAAPLEVITGVGSGKPAVCGAFFADEVGRLPALTGNDRSLSWRPHIYTVLFP